nr:hypothetical protein [Tanacetum cinerariifolium]
MERCKVVVKGAAFQGGYKGLLRVQGGDGGGRWLLGGDKVWRVLARLALVLTSLGFKVFELGCTKFIKKLEGKMHVLNPMHIRLVL